MVPLLRTWATEVSLRLEDLGREEGQGLVEYALILVLVSIISIAILAALGLKVSGVFQTITDAL